MVLLNHIKHIVITGCGPTGFQVLGTFLHLLDEEILSIDNIETMYATSAGAFVSVIMCLGYDSDTLYEYFVKRPWENEFPITSATFFNVFQKMGMLGSEFVFKIFKPLFGGKDISLDITLEEFHQYTKKEHHFYTIDVNDSFKVHDISYKTHPELSLLKALHMTSAVPFVFQPVFYEQMCLVDGGMKLNYPLDACLRETKCNLNEVLGITNLYEPDALEPKLLTEESSLLDMISTFSKEFMKNHSTSSEQSSIPYEIYVYNKGMSYDSFMNVLANKTNRAEAVDSGKVYGKLATQYFRSKVEIQIGITQS